MTNKFSVLQWANAANKSNTLLTASYKSRFLWGFRDFDTFGLWRVQVGSSSGPRRPNEVIMMLSVVTVDFCSQKLAATVSLSLESTELPGDEDEDD